MGKRRNQYLEHLIKFIQYTADKDEKSAQKCYAEMDLVFREMRDGNELSQIVDLLDHDNEHVKLWVSTHLLVFDEELARRSLNLLRGDQTSMIGFSAEMTLQEWEKGNLTYLME